MNVIFKLLMISILSLFLCSCSQDGEEERRSRVDSLIEKLADNSIETRENAYVELRDKFIRKRDVPRLIKAISQNSNSQVARRLNKLVIFMENKWRLPEKGWTEDSSESADAFLAAFGELNGLVTTWSMQDLGQKPVVLVICSEMPKESEQSAVELLLTLEPERLTLYEPVDMPLGGISFLEKLTNLEELDLAKTPISDLRPLEKLKNLKKLTLSETGVKDLTYLKEFKNLETLNLDNTDVKDLTPLEELSSLRVLDLANTPVSNLEPLKKFLNLWYLDLQNTSVADLSALKGLPELRTLNLENTKVMDLTPLKGLSSLRTLNLENTEVNDLTPLKGLQRLKTLNLKNTKVTDLTPLEGMSLFIKK